METLNVFEQVGLALPHALPRLLPRRGRSRQDRSRAGDNHKCLSISCWEFWKLVTRWIALQYHPVQHCIVCRPRRLWAQPPTTNCYQELEANSRLPRQGKWGFCVLPSSVYLQYLHPFASWKQQQPQKRLWPGLFKLRLRHNSFEIPFPGSVILVCSFPCEYISLHWLHGLPFRPASIIITGTAS